MSGTMHGWITRAHVPIGAARIECESGRAVVVLSIGRVEASPLVKMAMMIARPAMVKRVPTMTALVHARDLYGLRTPDQPSLLHTGMRDRGREDNSHQSPHDEHERGIRTRGRGTVRQAD